MKTRGTRSVRSRIGPGDAVRVPEGAGVVLSVSGRTVRVAVGWERPARYFRRAEIEPLTRVRRADRRRRPDFRSDRLRPLSVKISPRNRYPDDPGPDGGGEPMPVAA